MLQKLLAMVLALIVSILTIFGARFCSPSPGRVAFDGSSQCKRCAQTLVLDRHGNWEHDK